MEGYLIYSHILKVQNCIKFYTDRYCPAKFIVAGRILPKRCFLVYLPTNW